MITTSVTMDQSYTEQLRACCKDEASYYKALDIIREMGTCTENPRSPAATTGTAHDIAELKELQESLQKREQQLRLALISARVSVWDWNINEGTIEFISNNFIEEDLSSTLTFSYETFLESVYPEDRPGVQKAIEAALTGKEKYNTSFRIKTRDGRGRWVSGQADVFFDNDGRPVRMIGTATDISALIDVQSALKESESKTSSVVNSSLDGIVTVDSSGRIVEFNPAAERMFGYSKSAVLGGMLHELLIPPAKRATHINGINSVLGSREGKSFDMRREVQALRADGTEFPAELTVTRYPVNDRFFFTSFIRDISERKLADEELNRTRATLYSIIESTKDPVWFVDLDLRFQVFNSAARKFFETNRHLELRRGMHISETTDAKATRIWEQMYGRARAGEFFTMEVQLEEGEGGNTSWFTASFNPVYLNEQIIGISIFCTDITHTKEAAEQLRKSEQRLDMALSAADLQWWDWDLETGKAVFSTDFAELMEYPFDELEPHIDTWYALTHPDDIHAVREALDKHLGGMTGVFETEHRLRKKFGEWIWVRVTGKLMTWTTDGRPKRIVGLLRDITRRKITENKLYEKRKQIASIVSGAMDAILMLDSDLKLTYINPSAETLFGLRKNEAVGKGIRIIFPESTADLYLEYIIDFILSDATHKQLGDDFQIKGRRSDGEEFPIEARISKHFQDENVYCSIFIRDISERRQALAEKSYLLDEIQIKQDQLLRIALETQEQERKRIAQDLHDSLGQILSAAKLTLTSGINDLKKGVELRPFEKLDKGIILLNSAIQEARMISRNVMPSTLMSYGLVSALKELVSNMIHTNGLNINFYSELRSAIENNAEIHLYRSVQEILGNILKHSEATEVNISLLESNKNLTLMVEDNGVGFDPGTELRGKGTGLKNIFTRAEYLGARVTFDSIPGRGCTVIIEVAL